jgi:branched-chain amino acid aminotransferase
MPNKINLTEKYLAFNSSILHVSEFYYSYSINAKVIYEVVRVKDSTPIFLENHLDRLWNSLKILKLIAPDRKLVITKIKELLLKNPVIENNIRISVVYDLSTLPNLIIYFIPSVYPTNNQKENGISILSLNEYRLNPNIKIENSELRTKADSIIKESECYEVLLINKDGFITEGSRSNIFLIKNDTLITPPIDLVLGGITREIVMKLAKENGVEVKEEMITCENLSNYEGAFITGTSPGILPIAAIDDQKFSVNLHFIKSLIELYHKAVEDDILKFKV